MDEKFQDRIDNYLLNRMDDVEKNKFLREVEQDEEKKEQLEFTRKVKDSICSREEKLRTLAQFLQQYEEERKSVALRPTGTERAACYSPVCETASKPMRPKNRKWLWISGVAAVLVVGFFAIKPMFVYDSSTIRDASPNFRGTPPGHIRGVKEIFDSSAPVDSMDNDTIKFNIEKKIMPDE
ncbi:MAG: hypothetical protein LUD00_00670 [Prevotellaceae bacterium]|nr:hypothetical protein [Prevotellaceae bacterium]